MSQSVRVAGVPRAEQVVLPPGYGTPCRLLEWEIVVARLVRAKHYWLATVRPDGRPHVVPRDGLWAEGRWWFGGSDESVKHRNLVANARASLHLEDAATAVIVEGTCSFTVPTTRAARQLAAGSKEKYGYGPPLSAYRAGVWALSPVKVLAWTELPVDATRFVFDQG